MKKKAKRAIVQQAVAKLPRGTIFQQVAGELPAGYAVFLEGVKARIRNAQVKAYLSAQSELISLYWSIGRDILIKERKEGWGTNLIDRLGNDIQQAFPGLGGFSRTNIYRMRAFYLAYASAPAIVPQPVGQLGKGIVAQPVGQLDGQPPDAMLQIPWGHNVALIEKVKDRATRLWYAKQAISHGWSRNILALQIESGLHKRQGKAVTNFKTTLAPPQSDLAQQVLKDPYVFDFLTIADDAKEQAIERDLVSHITHVLLEMGTGFAFVGRQVHLEVSGEDFYVDLLFYHLRLRCFVVIDLKVQPFKPEFAGKMNFYLSAVDDLLRHPEDKPSIGLILCREKNRITAEYALRDVRKPIGVAGWQTMFTESLPKELAGDLPTIEQIELELATGRLTKKRPASP